MKIKTNQKLTDIIARLYDMWPGANLGDYEMRFDQCFDAIAKDADFYVHSDEYRMGDLKQVLLCAEKAKSGDVYEVIIHQEAYMLFIGNLNDVMKNINKHCKKFKIDIRKLLKDEYENN